MTELPETAADAPVDVIVGGSGMVGRMLARAWRARGGGPAFQYRRGNGAHLPRPDLHWDPMLGPEPFVEWARLKGGCRTMVVLAGVTLKSGANFEANVPVAEACLEAAYRAGVSRVLYASTSAVYGPGSGRPFTEADPPNPANAYGVAKVAAEAVCARYREKGMMITALRIGNVAGADQLLINAGKATDAAPLKLDRFADGTGPRRCYIGAGMLARVLERLMEAEDLPDVLNVGTPVPVTMEGLLTSAGTIWRWVPAPASAVQDLVLDCSALAEIVPFRTEDSLPEVHVAEWRRFGDPQ